MKVSAQDWGDSFDRLADELLSQVHEIGGKGFFRSQTTVAWQPAVNLYETPDRFLVCVEISGMEREQIEIQFGGGTLQVGGVRPKPCLPEGCQEISVLQMEIDSGGFRRSMAIPGPVRAEGIRAWYRRGYLWITLPRTPIPG